MNKIKVKKVNELQKSESFTVGALLAVSGGILDAYTYLCRGKVFANAQTGNIVLVGIYAADGDWKSTLSTFIPVVAFMLGVLITEIMKYVFKNDKMYTLHWRHFTIVLEILLLLSIVFIPVGKMNHLVNVVVSFVCSIQVQTFRKVRGHAFASTMCTGNLRSGTEALWNYATTKDKKSRHRCICSYGIILFFIMGAVVGAFLSTHFVISVIPLVIGIYIAVFLAMTRIK